MSGVQDGFARPGQSSFSGRDTASGVNIESMFTPSTTQDRGDVQIASITE